MTSEEIYYLSASVAIPVGAAWALIQWHISTSQKKSELRWKKSEAAWGLLDKIFEASDVRIALQTLDNEIDAIELQDGSTITVTIDDVVQALNFTSPTSSPKFRIIRNSVDSVLYALERLEQAIESKYILEKDILSPTKYYACLIYKHSEVFFHYADNIGYQKAIKLIERFACQAEPSS